MKTTVIFIARALLCLFFSALKSANLRKEILVNRPILTLAFLLLFLSIISNAQQPAKTLSVGNKLPAEFWQQKHQIYLNGETILNNLSQYKGKFLILDFWATWCGTCLKKFPLIDSLSANREVQFILVNSVTTGDKIGPIRSKIDKNAYRNFDKSVPVIYGDSFLLSTFPNYLLPHYVWIDPSGRVIAITGSDFFTKENLQALTKKTIKK